MSTFLQPYARQALANPVFDPDTQMNSAPRWQPEPNYSAMLSCNIGME